MFICYLWWAEININIIRLYLFIRQQLEKCKDQSSYLRGCREDSRCKTHFYNERVWCMASKFTPIVSWLSWVQMACNPLVYCSLCCRLCLPPALCLLYRPCVISHQHSLFLESSCDIHVLHVWCLARIASSIQLCVKCIQFQERKQQIPSKHPACFQPFSSLWGIRQKAAPSRQFSFEKRDLSMLTESPLFCFWFSP